MASNKDKGFACPVTLGYPDPGELEKVVEKQKENAARKKAEQNTSFCLLLGREFPPTRVKNTKWCLCGSCRPFKTVHENLCCREVLEIEMVPRTCLGQSDAVEGLKRKLKDCSKCITDHPSFEKLLDVETLSIMVENRRLDKKRRWMVCEDQKMIYRYCSYRSFVIWAYGPMGMRKRFELPACVRAAIMAKFPVDGEKAAGHKGRKVARKDAVECDEDEWRDRSA